jgi:hypothetical protein
MEAVMTKTATVHAQQMWEYMEVTRKTENYLTNELNELGKVGWELVSVMFHKDVKSSLGSALVWTAFLKRPRAPGAHPAPAAGQTAQTPATVAEEPKPPPTNQPARLEATDNEETFDFKEE